MTFTFRFSWKLIKKFLLIWIYTALIIVVTQVGFGVSVLFNSQGETETTACLINTEPASEQIGYEPVKGARLVISDTTDNRCSDRAANLKFQYTGSLFKFFRLEKEFHQHLRDLEIKSFGKSVQYKPDPTRSVFFGFLLTVVVSLTFLHYQRRKGRFVSKPQKLVTVKTISLAAITCIAAMIMFVWLPFQLFGQYFKVPDYLVVDMDALKPGLASWLGIAVLAPICEEVIFRAWLLEAWEKVIGAPAALILTSILFSLIHPMGLVANLIFIIPGLLFGMLWLKTRSLTACAVAHGVYNAFSLSVLFLAT